MQKCESIGVNEGRIATVGKQEYNDLPEPLCYSKLECGASVMVSPGIHVDRGREEFLYPLKLPLLGGVDER